MDGERHVFSASGWEVACCSDNQGNLRMDEIVARVWDNLIDRVSGPLHFRLLIQPAVALVLGIRDGLGDARRGAPAYFWSVFFDPSQRRSLLRQGWRAVAKVFAIAFILDVIYQLLVIHFVYPGEALLVAFTLAILPYLLIRGPANRIARAFKRFCIHR
jgi:hypothetical protein